MPMNIVGGRQFGTLNDIEFNWTGARGLNINDAPEHLDDADLTQAVNVYLRFDGGVEMRRGMTTHNASLSANPGSALFRFWQQVVGGVVQTPAAVQTLGQVGGNLYNVETGAQIGAANVLGTNALPWSITKIFDSQDAGGTDVAVIATGSGGPYRYDGAAVTVPTAWSTNAAGARWCAVVNNVLWFGGIPAQPNLLVGTLVGQPETVPFYQLLTTSQPVTGLAVIGQGAQAQLVVGMPHGLALLQGVNPANFMLQEYPFDDGVLAGRTMVADSNAMYWLGNSAVYAFDGIQAVDISKPVQPWILNDPMYPDYPMNGNRSLSWAKIYNNRLHIFYDSGNVGYPNTCLVFDLTVKGWTVLSGPKLNAMCLLDAPQDSVPWVPLVIDATKGQVYNWDAFKDAQFNVDDAGTAINAVVTSKFFKLGQPGTPKKLRRVYYELFAVTANPNLSVNAGAISDYGSNASYTIVSRSGPSGAEWDVAQWDQGTFANSGALQYVEQRVNYNLAGEAFGFTVNSSNTQAPWRWMGGSGVFVQGARR